MGTWGLGFGGELLVVSEAQFPTWKAPRRLEGPQGGSVWVSTLCSAHRGDPRGQALPPPLLETRGPAQVVGNWLPCWSRHCPSNGELGELRQDRDLGHGFAREAASLPTVARPSSLGNQLELWLPEYGFPAASSLPHTPHIQGPQMVAL